MKEDELITLAFEFKEQASYKAPSVGWMKIIEDRCNEIVGNYLMREHKDMLSTFKNCGKLRINIVMNDIGFEYPDYTKPRTSAEAGEKRTRATKASGSKASKKTANNDTECDESKYDKESPSNKAASSKKKKAKILALQEQRKGNHYFAILLYTNS
jgi:monoamine oxidase